MNRPSAILVTLTCLDAATSYSGLLSRSALGAYVLPSVLLLSMVGMLLRHRPVAAIVVIASVSVLFAEIAKALAGGNQGPVGKSVVIASVCAGTAVVLAEARTGAWFLLPVVVSVTGALALGAVTEPRAPVVATAVTAAAALAFVERDRRSRAGRPTPSMALLVALPLVAGAAWVALALQASYDARAPYRPFPASITGAKLSNPHSGTPHGSSPPVATRSKVTANGASPRPSKTVAQGLPRIARHGAHRGAAPSLWLLAGLVLAGVVVVALAWLVLVKLSWSRLQRRLRRASSRESVRGAWLWTASRLASFGQPVPLAHSPDVVAGTPEAGPLSVLARLVSGTIFARPEPVSEQLEEQAWREARVAVGTTLQGVPPLRRLRAALTLAPRFTGHTPNVARLG